MNFFLDSGDKSLYIEFLVDSGGSQTLQSTILNRGDIGQEGPATITSSSPGSAFLSKTVETTFSS